jgi:hypothetical protein
MDNAFWKTLPERMSKMPRRKRDPIAHFVGQNWSVTVVDGNGEQWLFHSPDCVLGPITSHHGDMTREKAADIARALQATLDRWRQLASELPPGGAEIIPLKP